MEAKDVAYIINSIMEDKQMKDMLDSIYGVQNRKEDKKMEYFITISQGTNKLEFTTGSMFATNQLVDYINEINNHSDAKLSFRMDPIKED